MKKLLSLYIFLSGCIGYAQIIDINNAAHTESSYSLQELVENVLISGDCAEVDNFTSQAYGSPNQTSIKSYGYFKKPTGSTFAFDEGIVLTTGNAYLAGNNTVNIEGEPSQMNGISGDTDLEIALGVSGTEDATYVKFNFVPTSPDFNFNFIMASEEYNNFYECLFSDSFAFLLREVGTTTYTNLAVLPNGQPVSVTNINNSNNCPANVEFFDGYNLPHTNYGGQTRVLTANATVTPYQTYEIKLVVADQGDSSWDSAIFIEAGSFNFDLVIGEDLTIDNGNPACSNETVTLDTQIPPNTADHTWFYNGMEIPGEIGSTIDVTNDGTYSVIVDYGTNCSATDSVIIEFTTSPVANPIPDIIICDSDNDGISDFDLVSQNNFILDTQLETNFTVSYYASQTDADAGTNPLGDIYTNQVAYQEETIFARIESNENPDCFDTTSFLIDVARGPIATPVLYELCDNTDDGDDTNGFVEFDLNSISSQVLNGQDSTFLNISYHLNQEDANINASPLPSLYTNITANEQQIVVRLESTINTDCYGTANIDLKVNALPITANNVTLEQCDDDLDGLTLFNLTQAYSLISANYASYDISFYETEVLAEGGLTEDQITNLTTYPNLIPFNDVVYARSENAEGCNRITRIDLVVGATQIPASFHLDYVVCDDNLVDGDDRNGIASFDFSDATAQIEALFPVGQNIEVSYYTNITDALSEENAITDISNFRNENSPFTQNIFVRIDNESINACLGLGEHITLTVNSLPEINPISNYELCSDTNEATFDLTTKDNEVIGAQTTPLLISYFESQEDANNNTNPIAVPYLNNQSPRTIYVRALFDYNNNGVEDPNECLTTDMSFELIINPNPNLNPPTPIEICSYQIETEYNLTIRTDEITGNNNSINLAYYESQLDIDNNNPITNPTTYLNTILNREIMVVGTNEYGCYTQTILTLNTILYANLNLNPSPIEECEVDNDGYDNFDITRRENSILNGLDATEFEILYYVEEQDALDGNNNTITNPLDFTNTIPVNQTIYVRVTPNSNNCSQIIPLKLIVNPVPKIALENKYVICLDANSQVIDPVSETVLPNPPINTHLSETEYTFQWYYGEFADSNNLIVGATQATYTPTTAGFYTVNAINNSTGCTIPGTTEVVDSYPPESITAEVLSQSFTNNNTIDVTIVGQGNYLISLDYGVWQSNTTFENVSGGEHHIRVRDQYNCNELIYELTVIDYPKFFTPNNDGYNDTWNLYGMQDQPNAKVLIYNRYGKLIKQISPAGSGWDGTFNGEPLPTSDYWFTIEYTEPITNIKKIFKSHFTLKR
ncbi:choice-of-anchor L domain-containing protein [Xanthomarina sp. F1114]|uniref:T9SS type B sorting domain-containing protein n=1 Tax=Xanthomarina sp. F1114 TaxID=2996019 RepID=UPI00225E1FE0|nr:choice-of-anchor L domain-containing protein [Xanthomarina sp. F1114]MCX7547711.1 choice-of-anchor L domain-containing protein [Xanthomarina sp. F1114]